MVKYSFEDLIKFCKENKFELRENYETIKFHCNLTIHCKCLECNETATKMIYKLYKDKFIH